MGLQQQIETTLASFFSLQKAGPGISTSTGLVFYDLEAEAKFQYVVLAPIRQTMPRIGPTNPMGGQGLSAHWNSITNPNAGNVQAEAQEGQSGALITPTVTPKIATYKLLALDNVVTWQSEWSGVGYQDVRAAALRMTLDSMILAEEPRLLWGNSGTAGVGLNFGQANTPALNSSYGTSGVSATGGTLSNGTYYVACAALTYQGYQICTAPATFGGGGSVAVVPQYVKANGDGTSTTMNGGVSQVSALSGGLSVALGGITQSFQVLTTAIAGACAYAWWVGTANAAASCYFNQVTTINVATVTLLNASTYQNAAYVGSGTDYSANPLAFDGLITQAVSGGGYFKSLNGAALTSDDAGGCNEINTAFKYFWDVYKISPTHIWAGSGTVNAITKVILGAGVNNSGIGWRVDLQNTPGSVGSVTGTAYVSSINNRFALGARKPVPVDIHPNIPDGHLFMDLEINPYPSSNIPYARAVRTLRDFFLVQWPPQTALWRNSIFSAELCQVYTPYGMGLLSGISN